MGKLVFNGANGQALTNSLLVAEKFGKEHKDVLESIRGIILAAENSATKMFYFETQYENRGKMYPMFVMNKDGFSLLVMGFTGKDALQFKMEFLNAFNKMEAMLKSDDYILARSQEILQNRLQEAQQRVQILEGENEHLSSEVKQLAPKAEYTDRVLQSTSTYTMTQVAKELGMSAIALEKKLHDAGVMFKQSGQWILYYKYQDKGYTKPRTHHYTHNDGTTGTNTITVWTERGRACLHQLLKQK